MAGVIFLIPVLVSNVIMPRPHIRDEKSTYFFSRLQLCKVMSWTRSKQILSLFVYSHRENREILFIVLHTIDLFGWLWNGLTINGVTHEGIGELIDEEFRMFLHHLITCKQVRCVTI